MKLQYEYSPEGGLIARLGDQHVSADPLVVIRGLSDDNETLRQRVAELEEAQRWAEVVYRWIGDALEYGTLGGEHWKRLRATAPAIITTPTPGEGGE